VERYRDLVFRTAYVIVGDPTEAEDATQEAFVKAYYALPRFRTGAPFRPWLLQIVANEARNRRKAAGRRTHLALRVAGATAATNTAAPEDAVLAAERRAMLLGALETLRAEDRLAIAYRYFWGLAEPELAGALGCARGTVKSRLSHALRRLRERLAAAGESPARRSATTVESAPSHPATTAEGAPPRSAAPEGLRMAEDLSRLADAELERALADLGEHVVYPPTPPVVPAVRRRLLAGPAERRAFWPAWLAPRWGLALGALAVVSVVGLVVASFPARRAAIADLLGLRGITITHLPTVPPAMIGRPLRDTLGTRLTLEQAQARVPYRILLPSLPELGPPDEVYVGEPPAGGQVTLLYRARGGEGLADEPSVDLLLAQFRGDLLQPPEQFGKGLPPDAGKGLGPQTRLDEVQVHGARGYWIEGPPHLYWYRDAADEVQPGSTRLVGNVLLWEQAGLTLRLESALSKTEALHLADSVR
jgi:RNA polymerase sigma factor (sigma-70 family)